MMSFVVSPTELFAAGVLLSAQGSCYSAPLEGRKDGAISLLPVFNIPPSLFLKSTPCRPGGRFSRFLLRNGGL